jgi:hypothetical protein
MAIAMPLFGISASLGWVTHSPQRLRWCAPWLDSKAFPALKLTAPINITAIPR